MNPARSFGPALFVGSKALAQVWMYLIVPTLGRACRRLAGQVQNARFLNLTIKTANLRVQPGGLRNAGRRDDGCNDARFGGSRVILLGWPGAAAIAQDYPSHPVKIIVPFGAGGPADIFSRQIAQYLSDQLQAVLRDRKPARRGLGDRHRRGREIGAGWLHAACDVEHAHDQRVADPEQAVSN